MICDAEKHNVNRYSINIETTIRAHHDAFQCNTFTYQHLFLIGIAKHHDIWTYDIYREETKKKFIAKAHLMSYKTANCLHFEVQLTYEQGELCVEEGGKEPGNDPLINH